MVFLVCVFGYMDWMIMFKWTHQIVDSSPPGIINTMIAMCLGQGVPEGQQLYHGQDQVQNVLLLMAVVAIPVMLIPKPLYIWCTTKTSRLAACVDFVIFL
jgi:V-type H+-transporting ATPase subunit a